jgi:hypothetical protein
MVLLTGIEIRLFLVLEAFSRLSGTPFARSASLSLHLATKLLDSSAAASGCDRGSVGPGVSAGSWRRFGKPPLTPRITPRPRNTYLRTFDLSDFDAKAPPQKTAAFWRMVDAGWAPEDAELADVLDSLGNPAAVTVSTLCIYASEPFREYLQDRRNSKLIPHHIQAAEYVPVRNDAAKDGQWVVAGKRQTVYAKKSLAIRDRIVAAATKLCREAVR